MDIEGLMLIKWLSGSPHVDTAQKLPKIQASLITPTFGEIAEGRR